jgi:DNA helicase-2/ATP-dependent DNA helicase PcrA
MQIKEHTIHLNPEQEKAVRHTNGSLLVIAGAGSGKTRVITARIAHLIADHQIHASAIVALTFTNKAANEMKERIATFIGTDQELPFVGTFHSYCVRILRQNRHLIGTPFLTILDDDDQKKLLQDILKRNNLHSQIAPRQAAYHISQMKNKNIHLDKPSHHLFEHPLMPNIYQAYEEEKRNSKTLDFDDLLLETVRLFKQNSSFKEQFQSTIRHILVDEYQDTNLVQHELLRHMALQDKKLAIDSICAVGDEDQSIYSWRGANVTNMLNFQKDFNNSTLIKIEQNYRSVQPILDTANKIIQNNTQRNPKKLWSDRKASNRIRLLTCLSEYQEADAVVQLIKTAQRHHPTQEIAILYRTHMQSRALEESLLKNSIAYKIIGGIQFYERKEIKDLLAYLKLIANPFDRASLFRIINTPTRGFGEKFEEQFHELLKAQPLMPFNQICILLSNEIAPAKYKAIHEFLAIFDGLNPHDAPSKAIKQIIERTHYLSFIKKSYERDEVQTRLENIQELVNAIHYFESQQTTTITQLLEEITLMQEKLTKTNNDNQKVLLMTLHAAKGLEFDLVVLAGLEQGILPTTRTLYEDGASLEEERRLLYVGITRAKERLVITHTKFRYTYGQMSEKYPSQFLQELPATLIVKEDCAYWNNARFANYFAEWMNPKYHQPMVASNEFASIIKNKISISASPACAAKPPPSLKLRRTDWRRRKRTEGFERKKISPSIAKVSKSIFRQHQPVMHKKYGSGIVQAVEKRIDQEIVTVRFKSGVKKIVAKFLEVI